MLHSHYKNFFTTTASSAPNCCISTFDLTACPFVSFRFPSPVGFHCSITKPIYNSCCLYAVCQHRQFVSQVIPVLVPGQIKFPRFLTLSISISTPHRSVYLRSALVYTPEMLLSASLFPVRSIPPSLDKSTAGWFGRFPCCSLPVGHLC